MSVNSQRATSTIRLQTQLDESTKSSSRRSKGKTFSNNSNRPSGQKRRFGAAGITNVLLTNFILQVLLASNMVSVTAATLISQLVNTCLGYAIYGKLVFKAEGLRHHGPLLRYLLLMTVMWVLNSAGIAGSEDLGINKNLAAAGLVPCLAVLSFALQKHWVFK